MRIERFFAMVKAVMRGQGRRVIKRMHLAECIEMVLAAVNSKVTLSDYGEYMNNEKRLIMHDFPDVKVGEMVGRLLTNFAALVVKEQYKLLAREFYTTVSTGADTYETKHQKTGKVYQIICNPDSGEMCCNCYVSCMFGLPCRHVLAARRFQSMHTFDIKDCLPRWQRLSSESSGEHVDLYHDVVLDALSGHMDENEENPEVENKAEEQTDKKLSRPAAKFNEAFRILSKDLSSVVAAQNSERYQYILQQLQRALDHLDQGYLFRVLPVVETASVSCQTDLTGKVVDNPAHLLEENAQKETEKSPRRSLPEFKLFRDARNERGRPPKSGLGFYATQNSQKPETPDAPPTQPYKSKPKRRRLTCPPVITLDSLPDEQLKHTSAKRRRSSDENPEEAGGRNRLVKNIAGRFAIHQSDMRALSTIGQFIDSKVVAAVCALAKAGLASVKSVTGFLSPLWVQRCQPDYEVIQTVREDYLNGKTIVQPLFNMTNHFVTVKIDPQTRVVTLYDSLGWTPSPWVLLQIWTLCGEKEDVNIVMPPVPKQSSASNNCAVYSCAFALDIMLKGNPETSNYKEETEFPQWLKQIIETEIISKPPKKRGRFTHETTKPETPQMTLSAEQAANLRVSLNCPLKDNLEEMNGVPF